MSISYDLELLCDIYIYLLYHGVNSHNFRSEIINLDIFGQNKRFSCYKWTKICKLIEFCPLLPQSKSIRIHCYFFLLPLFSSFKSMQKIIIKSPIYNVVNNTKKQKQKKTIDADLHAWIRGSLDTYITYANALLPCSFFFKEFTHSLRSLSIRYQKHPKSIS